MHLSNAFMTFGLLLGSSVVAYPTESPQKRNNPWSSQCETCFVNCAGECIDGFYLGMRVDKSDMSTLNMCGTQCSLEGQCNKIEYNGGKRQEAGLITDWMKSRDLVTGVGQDSPGRTPG
ncbi:hypothetical protein LTS12_027709 [Elasticomyces elasticus]|nr:hypothetical protein LTS12_027709 [Elasticomyces elasticus]